VRVFELSVGFIKLIMGMSKAAGELIDRISDGEINQPQKARA